MKNAAIGTVNVTLYFVSKDRTCWEREPLRIHLTTYVNSKLVESTRGNALTGRAKNEAMKDAGSYKALVSSGREGEDALLLQIELSRL